MWSIRLSVLTEPSGKTPLVIESLVSKSLVNGCFPPSFIPASTHSRIHAFLTLYSSPTPTFFSALACYFSLLPPYVYVMSHLYKIILWRGGKAPRIQCNRQDLWDSNLILQVLYLSVWLGLCGTVNPNFLRCRALVFFPPYRLSLSCQIVLDTSDVMFRLSHII